MKINLENWVNKAIKLEKQLMENRKYIQQFLTTIRKQF